MTRGDVILVIGAVLMSAALTSGRGQERLRVDVNLRTVRIVVQDSDGAFRDSVPREDFLVTEGGRPQTIRHFDSPRDRPLSIAMVVDASGSMATLFEPVSHALGLLVGAMRESDEALLLTYNARPRLQAGLTSDPMILMEALTSIVGEMSTDDAVLERLYDGVSASVDHLEAAGGRRVVVVLTNGMDTLSRATPEDLGGDLRESNALLYAISFDPSSVAAQRLAPMTRLAAASGGRAVLLSDDPSEAESVLMDVIDELHHQYELGYYPEGAGSGPVEVRTSQPGTMVTHLRSGGR
jgi:VWFA-related protein